MVQVVETEIEFGLQISGNLPSGFYGYMYMFGGSED